MLTPDKVRYENGVMICEKIIPENAVANRTIASWVLAGQPMKPKRYMDPIGITIHNTSDLKSVHDDAEQYTRATWPNCNMAGAVVHYFVDDVGAWQNLREDESGWHASDGSGNGNRRTIAIECIMDGSGSKEDLGARDNAARLIAAIMKRNNWTVEKNLYTHNHWMKLPDQIVYGASKNCPLYLLPKYSEFKKLINSYMVEEKTTTSHLRFEDINVGDILEFTGGAHYFSASSSARAKTAYPSKVKVMRKYLSSSAHPIYVRAIDDQGKFSPKVNGWVNLKDLLLTKTTSFIVKVTVDNLAIKKSPSLISAKVGNITDRGAYTIVEVDNGWGLLKSYRKNRNGWINLSSTKRI